MPEQLAAPCNLLVSLDREAAPVISHYKLKRDNNQGPWPVYSNGMLSLIVSGMGKTSAAAACAWLQACRPAYCWLNIGIAGHATADIGSVWLVNSIHDSDSGESWYPQSTLLNDIAALPLVTVSKPVDYETDSELYDMEASGFMASCTRFTTLEWIQSLKIVSDNRKLHWQQLDKNTVPELVSAAIPAIDKVITTLTGQYPAFHCQAHDHELANRLLAAYHFTTTQRNRLVLMLTQCRALGNGPDIKSLMNCRNAGEILNRLAENNENAARSLQLVIHD